MSVKYARKKRIGRGGFIIFLAVILTVAAMAIGIALFFRVGSIEVAGTDRYSAEEIIEASGIGVGENMFTLEERGASSRIVSSFDYISDVAIVKEYPANVVIEVTEDMPIAYIRSGSEAWLVSSDMTVYAEETPHDTKGLIQIIGVELENPESGKAAELGGGTTQLKCAKEFLGSVKENGITKKIKKADLSNIGAISFDFDGRFAVNLGSEGSVADKVTMLVGAMDKLEANAKGRLEFTTDSELHFIPAS